MAPADQPHRAALRAPHPARLDSDGACRNTAPHFRPRTPHRDNVRGAISRAAAHFRHRAPTKQRPVGNPKVVDGASVFVARAQRRSARSGQAQVRAYTIIYRTRAKEEGTAEALRGHKCEGRRHARSAPRAQVPCESARRATAPHRRRPLIGSPVRPTPRGQHLRAPPPRPRWPCGAKSAPTPPWASDAAHAAAPRR